MSIISVDDLKNYISIADTVDDSVLQVVVDAADRIVHQWCGAPLRRFDKTATADASARTFWVEDQCSLRVTDFWETSVLVVKTDTNDDGTYDHTLTLNADYLLEPINAVADSEPYTRIVLIGDLFPSVSYRPAVQVTAAWGWPSIPAAVKLGTLMQAARLFDRRHSVNGFAGGFGDFGPARVSTRIDPDVQDDIAQYRRVENIGVG